MPSPNHPSQAQQRNLFRINLTHGKAKAALVLLALAAGFLSPVSVCAETPAKSEAKTQTIPEYPLTIDGGSWKSGHVQGVAVNPKSGHVYFSFTNLLVKTDLQGKVLGTIGGFTGHLGDLDFNEADGRVYGSLEYKAQTSFYIAIIDVDQINEMDMSAQDSEIFQTVYLPEVVADYTADLDGNGVFDGNTGKTADHRFGCSGIDGVSFGPAFGKKDGKRYLTVAYGVYTNLERKDNDHQVLLQYDSEKWVKEFARPLTEAEPHHSGPEKPAGKYFIFTGNTHYGVQNLAYDESGHRWLLGVYRGKKPAFPNYTLFSVLASAEPVMKDLVGTGEKGLLLPLAPEGNSDEATGTRGWMQNASTGMVPLGNGLTYLAEAGKEGDQHTAKLILYRWVGRPDAAFEKVTR